MFPLSRLGSDRRGFKSLQRLFYFCTKNTSGAGRIRTSDLQRPRLASCQARQRPQDCTVFGGNPYYMSIKVLGTLS